LINGDQAKARTAVIDREVPQARRRRGRAPQWCLQRNGGRRGTAGYCDRWRSTEVGAAQWLAVGADQQLNVGADQVTEIGGNQTVSVGKTRNVAIGNDRLAVGKDLEVDCGGAVAVVSGKDITRRRQEDNHHRGPGTEP
jgi:hypothetical protein